MDIMDEEQNNIQHATQAASAGLTVDYAWNFGKAVADALATTGKVIVFGQESHTHLKNAVIEGLRLQGRDVIDGGSGDATAASELVTSMGLSGAVVIESKEAGETAALTVLQEDGLLVDHESGLGEIEATVESGNFVPAAQKGELTALA